MKIFNLTLLFFLFFLQLFLYNLDEYKIQFLLFVFSYIFLLIFIVRQSYFLSPISLFVFITFFYLSAGSLDLHYFTNPDYLLPKKMGLLLLLGYLFIYLLVSFVSISKKIVNINFLMKINNSLTHSNYSHILYSGVTTLFFLSVISYIIYFLIFYGFSIGAMSRGTLYGNSSFFLTLLKILIPFLAITSIWLQKNYQENKRRRGYFIILFIVLFVLFDMLFKGDRRVSVSMLLAIGSIYYYQKNIPKKYVILGIFGPFILYFLGAIRNRPLSMWSDNIASYLAREFSPSKTEFGPFSMIANYLLREDLFMTMPTMFTSFLSALPGFIFSDRPLASSVWFVKTYFTDYYNSGGGLAFNIIVDAVLNFGYFAPFILALFYFLFLSIGKQKGKIGILINALLIYTLTFTARFDFTSIYQTVIYGWGILFLIFYLFLFFKRRI